MKPGSITAVRPLDTAFHVHATGELGPQGGALALTAKGTFRGDPAHARAKASSLLLTHAEPTRLHLETTVGPTSGTFGGTLQASMQGLRSIDAQVDVRGQTIEHLFDLFGINAPATPPYELQGRLRYTGMRWSLESFSGEVGDSDLRGSLSYDRSAKKPMLTADLRSKLLDFDDRGPLVGTPPGTGVGETASPAQKRQAQAGKRNSDLLPEAQFETKRWSEMNADVRHARHARESGRDDRSRAGALRPGRSSASQGSNCVFVALAAARDGRRWRSILRLGPRLRVACVFISHVLAPRQTLFRRSVPDR